MPLVVAEVAVVHFVASVERGCRPVWQVMQVPEAPLQLAQEGSQAVGGMGQRHASFRTKSTHRGSPLQRWRSSPSRRRRIEFRSRRSSSQRYRRRWR